MEIHSAVSSASMQQMQKQFFAKADTDRSGSLNFEEFTAVGKNLPTGIQRPAGAPDPSQVFRKLDADGNGELSQAELPKAPHSNFGGGMSQPLLQSLHDADTALLDALFNDQSTDGREKPDALSSTSHQEISSMIEQYLASYLSEESAQLNATYQVRA